METKRVLLVAAILALLVAGVVSAARDKVLDEVVTAGGAKDAVIDISYGVGHISLIPNDMDDVATFHCRYDPEKIDVNIDKNLKGSTLYVSANSEGNKEDHFHGDIKNDWDVTVSTRYPAEMKMEVGAAEADIDLGGVPLRQLSMEIGAASGTLDFSKPNPERMDEFKIEAGASSVDLAHLGNANFRHMKFEGGAGSFDLDLRGKYTGESELDIEIGVSSADIILPDDIPVRIESEDNQLFSSVKVHGGDVEEVEDGIWESPGFSKATTRLIVHIEVGMGSANFRFKA